MLAIARILMCEPKVLMLDEPPPELVQIVVKSVFRIIKEINRLGVTILLVEQTARQALAISERAYVIASGFIAM